ADASRRSRLFVARRNGVGIYTVTAMLSSARLARFFLRSPRTAGPQPRDVLRLALPSSTDSPRGARRRASAAAARLALPSSQTRLAARVAEPPRPPLGSHYPWLKYRSPVSGSTVTTSCSGGSSAATAHAANAAAPAETPTSKPSSRASRRDHAIASSSRTTTIRSMTLRFRTPGTKDAPIPWIEWGRDLPPESTGEFAGSTAITRAPG